MALANPNDHGVCSQGGLWYECKAEAPYFQGCCSNNPCSSSGCQQADLSSGSLPPTGSDGTNFPNVACPAGALWYTCGDTTPSFQGCCTKNACQASGNHGCPDANLVAASFNATILAQQAASSSTTSPTSISTSTATSSKSSSSATSTSFTATTIPISTTFISSPKSNTGAIVGGVVGGVAVIGLLGLLFWFLRGRKKKEQNTAPQMTKDAAFPADPADNAINEHNESYYAAGLRPNGDKLSPAFNSKSTPSSPGPPPYGLSPKFPHTARESTGAVSAMSVQTGEGWRPQDNAIHEAPNGGGTMLLPQMLDSREVNNGSSRDLAVELPGHEVDRR